MALIVYMTAPDNTCAERIAKRLVERHLAACVNIIPGMRSIYRWEGAVECAEEVVLIAKTEESRYELLEKAVRDLHPYECPCIVAMPITHAEPAYAAWIAASTRMENV